MEATTSTSTEIHYFSGESSSSSSSGSTSSVGVEARGEFYAHLVAQLNQVYKATGLTAIDLSKKEFSPRKDALAFYVEASFQLSPSTWKDEGKALIHEMKKHLKSDDTDSVESEASDVADITDYVKDLNWKLHITISELYQLALEHKLLAAEVADDSTLQERVISWQKDYKRLLPLKGIIRVLNKDPVSYGGIKHAMLPNWYKGAFIDKKLYEPSLYDSMMVDAFCPDPICHGKERPPERVRRGDCSG